MKIKTIGTRRGWYDAYKDFVHGKFRELLHT